ELNDPDVTSLNAIEVGNIFPLGTMYAEKMGMLYTGKDGQKQPIWFGSYGIGPTRVMGTIVEVSHDDRGIIWPASVSPFDVHLVGIIQQESAIRERAEEVYKKLTDAGIDVLFDDRDDTGVGQKFADA